MAADSNTKCMLLYRLALRLNLVEDVAPRHYDYFSNDPCGLQWKKEIAVKMLRDVPKNRERGLLSYDEQLGTSKAEMLVIQNKIGNHSGRLMAEVIMVKGRRMQLVGATFQDYLFRTRAFIREDEKYAEVVLDQTRTTPIQLFSICKKVTFNPEARLWVNTSLIAAVDEARNIIFHDHYLFYQDIGPMEKTIDVGNLVIPSATSSLHHPGHDHLLIFQRQQSVCLIRLIQLLKDLCPAVNFVSKELRDIATLAESVKTNDAHRINQDPLVYTRDILSAAQAFIGGFTQDILVTHKEDLSAFYLDMIAEMEPKVRQSILIIKEGHLKTHHLEAGIEPTVAFQAENQFLSHHLTIQIGSRQKVNLPLRGVIDSQGQLTLFKRHVNLLEVAYLGSSQQVYNFDKGKDGKDPLFFLKSGIAFYR